MPSALYARIDDSEGEFLRRRSFDRYMQWNADLPPDLVERIWQNPHALFANGEKLQDKLRSTVARIDHPTGVFTWKYHNWGSPRRTIRKSLSQSPARKAWLDSHFLNAAGVPTPLARAYIERRLGPFQTCSYLLTDYVAGTSLYRLMRFERPTQEVVHHLAQQVAAIWQQLDDLCIWHNDFKTENLLVDPQGKVSLIDLERMRSFRDRSRLRQRQIKDARDLLHPRNWRSDPGAAEVFRQAIAATPAAQEILAGPDGAKHPLSRPLPTANRSEQLVTVLIACRNAADTILGCLESVRDMADEILVADAGSTDDTLRLVRKFGGCKIIERECTDEIAFAAWAHGQARHEWILRIRPDEQLNAELSRQVQDLLATEPKEDGFLVSRTVYFRGRRLRHGSFQNDSSIRLYRKQAGRYELRDGRVEVCVSSNRIGRVKSRLIYEACPSIEQCLREKTRLAARAAEDARQKGLHANRRAVLWNAPWRFVQSYVLRRGFLDGWAGLVASGLLAFETYLHEAMLWEIERPFIARRSLVHDQWRELKVFDPSADPVADSCDAQLVRTAA